MNLSNLQYLAVANWVSQSFPIIRLVLLILIAVLSLVLIFVVLFQPGNDGSNINAISGSSADSYYSINKSQTLESALKRLTVVLAIAIAVLTILFFISVAIYNGN